MEYKEQLARTVRELEKLEERKEKFLQETDAKKKRLLAKKREMEEKIRQEKNENVLAAVRENLGEIDEGNMGLFLELLKKNKDEFLLEMEIAAEDSKKSGPEEPDGGGETWEG